MSLAQTPDAILETREAPPSHFLMTVESFSLLGKNEIHKYESGEFSAGGYKWRLILYPNEDKTGIDSKYIAVHLAISSTNSLEPANWEVNAVFFIFLLNQISGNYHYSPAKIRRFIAMKSEWGIPNFISKKILMDPSSGFTMNNNCVFGAEVFIIEKSAVSEFLSVKNVTLPSKRHWKISNFSELGDIWTSEKFVLEDFNWDVLMYPKGQNHEKDHCGIFLRLIDSKRVKASFSICIKNQNNNKHKKLTGSHWFSTSSPNLGWSKFMELSTLNDKINGFIFYDCFHLEIEISVQAVV